jgi:OmcA/MtrC family decaheme c-type cytochrome
VPVTSTFDYFMITDPNEPVPRRTSVDIDRCNDCHALTSAHGTRRNDSIETCQVCHVPDAMGEPARSDEPMDMKHFLHRIHVDAQPYYPQRLSNCLACHTDDGFFPVALASGVLATSTSQGPEIKDPTDNARISPNTATCGVCHASADALAHMTNTQAGSVDACQDANGVLTERLPRADCTLPAAPLSEVLEDCAVCHGEGRSADTAVAHDLDL